VRSTPAKPDVQDFREKFTLATIQPDMAKTLFFSLSARHDPPGDKARR
jgi:hypothetical protein